MSQNSIYSDSIKLILAFGRKIKRVSDVNAMGYSPNPYEQGNQRGPSNLYPNLEPGTNLFQSGVKMRALYLF